MVIPQIFRYLELLDESLLCELNAFCKDLFAHLYKDRAIRVMFYEEPGTAEEVLIASYEYCGTGKFFSALLILETCYVRVKGVIFYE